VLMIRTRKSGLLLVDSVASGVTLAPTPMSDFFEAGADDTAECGREGGKLRRNACDCCARDALGPVDRQRAEIFYVEKVPRPSCTSGGTERARDVRAPFRQYPNFWKPIPNYFLIGKGGTRQLRRVLFIRSRITSIALLSCWSSPAYSFAGCYPRRCRVDPPLMASLAGHVVPGELGLIENTAVQEGRVPRIRPTAHVRLPMTGRSCGF